MFWHLPNGADGSRQPTAASLSLSSRAFGKVLDLAREERLTAYDAAYLELAMRLGVPLASKDADLCDAAQRLGVSVLRAD